MKKEFGELLTNYLSVYLPSQRNLSPNTIRSYRDMFVLFLRFCRDEKKLPIEKLSLSRIDVSLVAAFLDYVEQNRHCCAATRNQRRSAINSFIRFVQYESPERFAECQRILLIPSKRHEHPEVGYLLADDIAEILRQPGMESSRGRRDAVLLSLLYDSGARVQELIDLKVRDVRLDTPAQIRLTGKGRKIRAVPLMAKTVKILSDYIRENGLDRIENVDKPLFQNRYGRALSSSGVRHILRKHVEQARQNREGMRERVTPHIFRHSKAMHLQDAGNPLAVIGDILGHVSVNTTKIYSKANMQLKRNALESVANIVPVPGIPSWQQDKSLLEWLRGL